MEDVSSVRTSYKAYLEEELTKVPTYKPSASMLQDQWSDIVWPTSANANHDPVTGVDREVLQKVGKASVAVPEGFVSVFLELCRVSYVEASCRRFIPNSIATSRTDCRVLNLARALILPLQRSVRCP